jgi:RND family efflux transporter MFP subunit
MDAVSYTFRLRLNVLETVMLSQNLDGCDYISARRLQDCRNHRVASRVKLAMSHTKAAVATAVLAAFAAFACSRNQQAAGGPPQMPPTPVQIQTARVAPIEETTEYVATVKSLRSTAIQPQIDGQITQIFVRSGDRVRQGAPLVQIDPRRQQAAVSSQEAELAAREAAVTFARQQAQRSSELLAAGAISRQELEQAETALRTAEANLKALQAQVRQQEVQLRYYTVTAPTDGVVGDVPVRVGNQVTPQTVLTTIDQNQMMEVYVDVPLERSRDLKLGLPIHVFTSDGSERLASTAISFISPRVEDQTQSILVKGQLANPDGRLRASQYVRARIVWRTNEGLVVPVTAVLRINGQFFAFVAEQASAAAPNGQAQTGGGASGLVARQRAIKVGTIVGDNYPILEGIKDGERVVTSGAQKLADGAPIQAVS